MARAGSAAEVLSTHDVRRETRPPVWTTGSGWTRSKPGPVKDQFIGSAPQ